MHDSSDVSGPYRRWGKRAVDLLVSVTALLVLAPILLLLGTVVYFFLGPPIFFRQDRTGKNGKSFSIVKFRSMHTEAKFEHGQSEDDQRTGTFGAVLRASSLDELPQLWNVVKGDMSLVGPRPLPTRYVPRYSARQHLRHTVRPGISGLAQVSGRNSLNWHERLELDTWYVENLSLGLDALIVWRTLVSVLRRDGVRSEGGQTMPEFEG